MVKVESLGARIFAMKTWLIQGLRLGVTFKKAEQREDASSEPLCTLETGLSFKTEMHLLCWPIWSPPSSSHRPSWACSPLWLLFSVLPSSDWQSLLKYANIFTTLHSSGASLGRNSVYFWWLCIFYSLTLKGKERLSGITQTHRGPEVLTITIINDKIIINNSSRNANLAVWCGRERR